ncbi:hypothetical protein LCGC14_1242500 [marine sediment metagenome]|uniref:Uncharacterized protein n=1 Tax=marine sediment metagenome TaxID=412755 RepID=A0A0F9P9I7_9ZZZZ
MTVIGKVIIRDVPVRLILVAMGLVYRAPFSFKKLPLSSISHWAYLSSMGLIFPPKDGLIPPHSLQMAVS